MRRGVRGWPTGGVAVACCLALALALPAAAPAHSGDVIGEYAAPTVGGVIGANEYEGSCIPPATQTAGSTTYVFEICEANDETNDYWAVRIDDLTLDTGSTGDYPLIWFDNNHDGVVEPGSGSDCAPYGGAVEDYIGGFFGGFSDAYYCYNAPSLIVGFADGGSWDGVLGSDFTSGTGWVFEFSHPLDSADFDDYSLQTGDTAGWCFTYDDNSNPTDSFAFGELQFPPGCFVDPSDQLDAAQGNTTTYANVYKESKAHDIFEGINQKLKGLVRICKPCPPDPRSKLLEKINEMLERLRAERVRGAIAALQQFLATARHLLHAGELPEESGKRFMRVARGYLEQLKAPKPSEGPRVEGLGAEQGAAHPGDKSTLTPEGAYPPGEAQPPPPRGQR